MIISEQYKQAKEKPIAGFLARMKVYPKWVDESKDVAWYNSPFRDDPEPSFKLNRKRNEWIDFGFTNPHGHKRNKNGEPKKGGDLIDLVKILNPGINDQGALALILNLELPVENKFYFRGNSLNEVEKPGASIIEIKPLTYNRLINYIISRKISIAIANRYCKEVHYQTYKPFFGIGFQNDSNGWEIRLPYQTETFKGKMKIHPNNVTTIPGTRNAVHIFEGFFNFLSALEHYRTTKPAGTCIVLNGVGNLEKIIDTLEQYIHINLYLDNDQAGELAAEAIKSTYPNVRDYSKIIYQNNNDFNEYLTTGNSVNNQ